MSHRARALRHPNPLHLMITTNRSQARARSYIRVQYISTSLTHRVNRRRRTRTHILIRMPVIRLQLNLSTLRPQDLKMTNTMIISHLVSLNSARLEVPRSQCTRYVNSHRSLNIRHLSRSTSTINSPFLMRRRVTTNTLSRHSITRKRYQVSRKITILRDNLRRIINRLSLTVGKLRRVRRLLNNPAKRYNRMVTALRPIMRHSINQPNRPRHVKRNKNFHSRRQIIIRSRVRPLFRRSHTNT